MPASTALWRNSIPPKEQVRILHLLWEESPLTGYELHERITEQRQANDLPPTCYMSTLAQLRIMEKSGRVKCNRQQRSNRYRPGLTKDAFAEQLTAWLHIVGLREITARLIDDISELLRNDGISSLRRHLTQLGYRTDYRYRHRSA